MADTTVTDSELRKQSISIQQERRQGLLRALLTEMARKGQFDLELELAMEHRYALLLKDEGRSLRQVVWRAIIDLHIQGTMESSRDCFDQDQLHIVWPPLQALVTSSGNDGNQNPDYLRIDIPSADKPSEKVTWYVFGAPRGLTS